MSEEYIKVGRVFIAVQIIFVPIYFFILANGFNSVTIPFIPNEFIIISEIITRILVPIVLSIPFILFSYENRYQVSEAYEHMGDKILALPNSIKAFYGFNFFLVIIFGLPFFSLFVIFTGGYFLGVTIFGIKEDTVHISRPIIKYSTVIYLPFAAGISWIFFNQISDFFIDMIDLWLNNIEFLYFTALNIANAAILGGVLLLLFEYLEKRDYGYERPPLIDNLLAIIVFVLIESILLYFYFGTGNIAQLDQNQRLIFSIINIIGFILGLTILIARFLLKINESEESTSIFGWITIFAFQAVNLASSGELDFFPRTIAIFITCIIFIILFISSYREAAQYI